MSKGLKIWDDTNMEEKLTLWNHRTSELTARIARLKSEGASKRELRYLRTELEYYFGALKAIKSQIKNA